MSLANAVIGAEVTGVDVANGLDDAAFAKLEVLFNARSVLCLRGQSMTEPQFIEFATRFGPVEQIFMADYAHKTHPEIFLVSNIKENGRDIGHADAGSVWHTDMSYTDRPPRATLLYAVEVPFRNGIALGDTTFASTAAAYDALSDETKEKIEGLTVVHDVFGRRAKTGTHTQQDESRKKQPKVRHPFVRTHPFTGRKCLYVSPGECIAIDGMPDEEALPLINELAATIPPGTVSSHPQMAGRRHPDLGHLRGPASRQLRLPVARGTPPDVADDGRRRTDFVTVEIVSTGAAIGAEVKGVDLSQPLDEAIFAKIETAFDEFGVLIFRDQKIMPEQQVAFSAHFGICEINHNGADFGIAGNPEIYLISNITENGRPIGTPRAGGRWHTDMCYAKTPARATMLYAVEVPVLDGLPLGDTEFANAAAAWDALPEAMKSRIADVKAVFVFQGRKRGREISAKTIAKYPPVEHPVVRTHPRTGRKDLYVTRDDCTGIAGLDAEEAHALIGALADHIVRPEFVYRHRWRLGDLVVWDNCTAQHRAVIDYDLPQRRLMWRTTVQGSVPF